MEVDGAERGRAGGAGGAVLPGFVGVRAMPWVRSLSLARCSSLSC